MAIWEGATYKRGGKLSTKWGTPIKREATSWRNPHTGIVTTEPERKGEFKGLEKSNENYYGFDAKKTKEAKKLWIFVKKHPRRGTRGVIKHPRRLTKGMQR